MLKLMIVAAIASMAINAALATNPACETQATEKKLSCAAKTNFTKKCVSDATGTAKQSHSVRSASPRSHG